jgi:hypothetical protein
MVQVLARAGIPRGHASSPGRWLACAAAAAAAKACIIAAAAAGIAGAPAVAAGVYSGSTGSKTLCAICAWLYLCWPCKAVSGAAWGITDATSSFYERASCC